jgi:hypothetical protein
VAVAFAAPVALLATQLTLPAFADPATTAVPAAALVTSAGPDVVQTATAQTFTVRGAVQLAVARDGFTVQTAKPKPKPKPKSTVAPVVQSVAASAVGGTAASAPSPEPTAVPAPTPGSAQAIAADMVAARGWGADDFSCLVSLWNRESGWRTTAANPNGAYGIPQAYPGSKMSSAGADWQTNPATQITWGLDYIAARYGSPCGAWAHSEAVGSY